MEIENKSGESIKKWSVVYLDFPGSKKFQYSEELTLSKLTDFHFNLSRDILCLEFKELCSLYIHVNIFCTIVS